MLTILGTLLSSVFTGGATGLLGVLLQRFFDMKSKSQDIEVVKMNLANALELKDREIEAAKVKAAGDQAVAVENKEAAIGQAEAEERGKEAEADANMFTSSVANDRATYLSGLQSPWAAFMMGTVDWVRGMTRPVLTAYLVIITHLMFNWVRDLAAKNGEVLSAAQLKDIILLVVSTILYLATVAVVWWFGTRPPKQADAK